MKSRTYARFYHLKESVELELPLFFTSFFLFYFAFITNFDFFVSIISLLVFAGFLSRLLKVYSRKANSLIKKDLKKKHSLLKKLFGIEFFGLGLQALFFFVLYFLFKANPIMKINNVLLEYAFLIGLSLFSLAFALFFEHKKSNAFNRVLGRLKEKGDVLQTDANPYFLQQAFLLVMGITTLHIAGYTLNTEQESLFTYLKNPVENLFFYGVIVLLLLLFFSLIKRKKEYQQKRHSINVVKPVGL